MVRRGSMPWLLLAALLSILLAVWLQSAIISPFTSELFALEGWRGSSLSYANSGMRMVEQFVSTLLLAMVLAIAFGVVIDARRGV